MGRPAKKRTNLRLTPQVYAELSVFADANDVTMSYIAEQAVVTYLRLRGVRFPLLDDPPAPLAKTAPASSSGIVRRRRA